MGMLKAKKQRSTLTHTGTAAAASSSIQNHREGMVSVHVCETGGRPGSPERNGIKRLAGAISHSCSRLRAEGAKVLRE